MKLLKQKVTCDNCGGTHILFDAYAEWDVDEQEFVLKNTFDEKGTVCEDCNGIVSVTWKEVNVNWNEVTI